MAVGDGLPKERCGEYISGGLTSYPCWLDRGHDGPHCAVEVQSSIATRRVWEQNQVLTRAVPVPSAPLPPPVTPGGSAVLVPADVVDGVQRDADLFARLASAKSMDDLPEAIRSHLRASIALTSLGVLWHLAQVEFERGASSVVVSKEFLERVVPPTLQSYFSALSRQER